MSKWRITLKEEEVSNDEWEKVRRFLKKNNIKYREYRVW